MKQNFPTTIPSLNIGGRIFTDLQNLIQLYVDVSGTTNTNGTFRKQDSTTNAGYQVPTGKTLKIRALRFQIGGSSTANAMGAQILQSDNDVGAPSSTAFTNPAYFGGQNAATLVSLSQASQFPLTEVPMAFEVAAGKYLSAINKNAAAVNMIIYAYGYLE